ncbi:MAG: GNAT family N-acetyltransferase, partial [Bacteroidota bacterium]
NDILTGYAKLRRDSGFVQLPGARLIEIEKFYFKVEFHGCGLATELMNHILQIAMTEKAEWLCLGVDVNNHRAIRFYEKFGFRVFGEKYFRVGAQVNTDQLMKRKIS